MAFVLDFDLGDFEALVLQDGRSAGRDRAFLPLPDDRGGRISRCLALKGHGLILLRLRVLRCLLKFGLLWENNRNEGLCLRPAP